MESPEKTSQEKTPAQIEFERQQAVEKELAEERKQANLKRMREREKGQQEGPEAGK